MAANKIIRAGNKERYNKNIIHTILNVTDFCNFNCPYCCNASSRRGNVLSLNILHEFVEDLGSRNADEYIFSVSGGEPFLYPHLTEMLAFMENYLPNKRMVKFITNGSMLLKNQSLIEKYASKFKIRFALTLHLVNKNLDKLIDEIGDLSFKDLITVKILAAPGQIEFVKPIIKHIMNTGIKFYLMGIFDKRLYPLPYSEAEKAYILEHSVKDHPIIFHEITNTDKIDKVSYNHVEKFLHPDAFSYKGMNCAAGLASLRLGPDGYVIPCFGASRNGYRFNLAEKRLRDIAEFTKPIICPANKCHCDIFLKIPKWKFEKDRPNYLKH